MNGDQGVTHIQVYNILYFISYSSLDSDTQTVPMPRAYRPIVATASPAYLFLSFSSFLSFFLFFLYLRAQLRIPTADDRHDRSVSERIPPRLGSI